MNVCDLQGDTRLPLRPRDRRIPDLQMTGEQAGRPVRDSVLLRRRLKRRRDGPLVIDELGSSRTTCVGQPRKAASTYLFRQFHTETVVVLTSGAIRAFIADHVGTNDTQR